MGMRRGELCELLLDYCMQDLLHMYEELREDLFYEGIDIGFLGSCKFIELVMDHVQFDIANRWGEEGMSE